MQCFTRFFMIRPQRCGRLRFLKLIDSLPCHRNYSGKGTPMNMPYRIAVLGTAFFATSSLFARIQTHPRLHLRSTAAARSHSGDNIRVEVAKASPTAIRQTARFNLMAASSSSPAPPHRIQPELIGFVRGGDKRPSHGAAVNPWVLRNDTYAPTKFTQEPFVGNGYLGLRIPAIGQGYQGGNLGKSGFPLDNNRYTSSLVAGVYETVTILSGKKSDFIASLPTWSELDLTVANQTLNSRVPPNQITRYRQTVNMRDAMVTTSFHWTPLPNKSLDITYQVLTNRTHMHLGQVRLTFTPLWSGTLTITGILNGRGAERIQALSRSVNTSKNIATVMLRTPGRHTRVAETQLLIPGPQIGPMQSSAVSPSQPTSTAGERWTIRVTAGTTYQVIKYVGISTSNDPGVPSKVASRTVQSASRAGWSALLKAHELAWGRLWAHNITVPSRNHLQASVNNAFYLLYSSIRSGLAWSIPPAGLSSDDYGGEIFWDADTWMFPTLLAFHPDLAKSIVDFRYDTMTVAQANAARSGYQGGSWAWDNGPSGTCGGLAPCSHYEAHLQSDIALAQWQYYEATGDRRWLISRGYPVMKDVANFWVSRVTLGRDGEYHILKVTGPDEYTANVNDESATNAGAIVALRDAISAAKAVGRRPDPKWSRVADHIYIAQDANGTHPEYAGYTHQVVKQADTVLMTYPFRYVTNPSIAAADLDRYMPVTDPGGPAMTYSVESIIAAQSKQPGCLDFTLLQDSYLPFIRGAYDQFTETQYLKPSGHQGPPAFDFATGAGGFLQIFPYGFAGLRWNTSKLILDPTLPPQLKQEISLHGIRYHGRSLNIVIGPHVTTVTLTSGAPLLLAAPAGTFKLQHNQPVRLKTARPDLDATDNLARCKPATASSSLPAHDPASAVDGNDVTNWRAASKESTFQIDLNRSPSNQRSIPETQQAVVRWGATRPSRYRVSVLSGAGQWQEVASGPVAEKGNLHVTWKEVKSASLRFHFSGRSPASVLEIDVPVSTPKSHPTPSNR